MGVLLEDLLLFSWGKGANHSSVRQTEKTFIFSHSGTNLIFEDYFQDCLFCALFSKQNRRNYGSGDKQNIPLFERQFLERGQNCPWARTSKGTNGWKDVSLSSPGTNLIFEMNRRNFRKVSPECLFCMFVPGNEQKGTNLGTSENRCYDWLK